MIEYLFLAMVFLVLLGFAAILSHGDIGSPAVIVSAAFLLCTLAGIYNVITYNFQLSGKAVFIIAVNVFCFVGSALLVHIIVCRKPNSVRLGREIVPIRVPNYIVVFGSVVGVAALFLRYRDLSASLSLLGANGDWNDRMFAYRDAAMASDSDFIVNSGITNLCFRLLTVFAFSFLYICVYNWRAGQRGAKLLRLCLPIAAYVGCEVLSGVRLGAIRAVCALLVTVLIVNRSVMPKTMRLRISTLLRAAGILVGGCVLFWAAAWVVGRRVNRDPLDYFCSYLGCSFLSFDLFLQDGVTRSSIFGFRTFMPIYNSFARWTGDLTIIQSSSYEFRFWLGNGIGNVYTAFRPWINDFGALGSFVVSFVAGILYSRLQCAAVDSSGRFWRLYAGTLYAYLSVGLFSMPLVTLLTQNVFQLSFVFESIGIFILFRILVSGGYVDSEQV